LHRTPENEASSPNEELLYIIWGRR